jgi:hypothetical protein
MATDADFVNRGPTRGIATAWLTLIVGNCPATRLPLG